MKAKFFGQWNNEADVHRDFASDEVLDFDVIVGWYSYEDYNGSSYVLARRNGKLYENEAGHCSCNGLEEPGSWAPGEVSVAYLRNRVENGFNSVPPEVVAAVSAYLKKRK